MATGKARLAADKGSGTRVTVTGPVDGEIWPDDPIPKPLPGRYTIIAATALLELPSVPNTDAEILEHNRRRAELKTALDEDRERHLKQLDESEGK